MEQAYWQNRWQTGSTPWDLHAPSQPLIAYLSQIPTHERNCSILVPGCGSGYEALRLLDLGFSDVTMLDFVPEAIERLIYLLNSQTLDWQGRIKPLVADFYAHEGAYDLILEQTFLSTVPPLGRQAYAQQMAALLKPDGRLVGVVFNEKRVGETPPFSGTHAEYLEMFSPYLDVKTLELCYNSIAPRAGSEFWLHAAKPAHP